MSLFHELQRRNVFRVGAAYVVAAWLIIQVVETIFPAFGFGDAAVRITTIVLAIGLIPSVVFAWAFELTPEGLKKDSEVDRTQSIANKTGKKLDRLIMVVLALALGYFAFDKFVLSPQRAADLAAEKTAAVEQARQEGRTEALVESYGDKSIAVMAFDDMSEDGDQQYLSDGIAEELLNLLAKIPDLRVISRSSAFSFKGKELPLTEIAKRLNVVNILEGSVRKSGNQVRITAQLIDARSDTHLWSETYDKTLDDVFAVQDDIAAAVTRQLELTLLGKQPKSTPIDPAAFDLLLEARFVRRLGTADGYLESNELADRALQIDPDIAEPWVIKAKNYSNMAEAGVLHSDEAYEQARNAAETALRIAPEQAGPHSVTAWVAMHYQNDFVLAARHFVRAIELEPSDISMLSDAAAFLVKLRRFDQAITILEYVADRNPMSAIAFFNLGETYFGARRFDDSVGAFRTVVDLSPEFRGGYLWLSKALLLAGDAKGAYEAAGKEAFEPFRKLALALCAAEAGHPDEADAALGWLMKYGGERMPYDIASVWAYRHDGENTEQWIRKAISIGDTDVGYPSMDPLFSFILEDTGWINLMKALGKSAEQLNSIEFAVTLPETQPAGPP